MIFHVFTQLTPRPIPLIQFDCFSFNPPRICSPFLKASPIGRDPIGPVSLLLLGRWCSRDYEGDALLSLLLGLLIGLLSTSRRIAKGLGGRGFGLTHGYYS